MRVISVVATASAIFLTACWGPSNIEKMISVNATLEEALLEFKAGHYDVYYAKKMSVLNDIISIESSNELPRYSEETIKNGVCDTAAIKGIYQVVGEYIDPAVPLLKGSGEMDLSEKLDTAEYLETGSVAPIDHYDASQYRDCDRLIPGFSEKIANILKYVEVSRLEWRKIYQDRTGEKSEAVEADLRQDSAHSAHMQNLANWGSLSEDERRFFTLGDNRVEECVSAFISGSAPSPNVASAGDIADLCRSGLKQ